MPDMTEVNVNIEVPVEKLLEIVKSQFATQYAEKCMECSLLQAQLNEVLQTVTEQRNIIESQQAVLDAVAKGMDHAEGTADQELSGNKPTPHHTGDRSPKRKRK